VLGPVASYGITPRSKFSHVHQTRNTIIDASKTYSKLCRLRWTTFRQPKAAIKIRECHVFGTIAAHTNLQRRLSHVDAGAATSAPAPDSSPLSEICSEYAPEAVAASRKIEHVTDRDFAGDESQVLGGDTSSLSSPQATPAEEGSGSDKKADLSDLQCRHCKKTFVHDKSLKVGQSSGSCRRNADLL
jgi:hypothetical protein